MERYIFSDLACENFGKKSGIEQKNTVEFKVNESISFTRTEIKGSGIGGGEINCTTVFTPALWGLDDDTFFLLSDVIESELCAFTDRVVSEACRSFLVVGLGNGALTPDALGVETVRNIAVTPKGSLSTETATKVYAVIPDVCGNTGIETAQVVGAYTELLRPSAVIVVDSLCARCSDRLATTVQIWNDGVLPGSAVGNGGRRISSGELGVPVITLGIPTVIRAASLLCDITGNMAERDEYKAQIEKYGELFVTPKEIDVILRSSSLLLARSINRALAR